VKIVVVSPHQEDAALGLGLAIGAWLEQGHTVEVVSCFARSENAPYSDADSVHANDRMSFVSALRRREEEEWRKLYRSAKLTLTDLNLKDAPLRLHCAPEEVFSVAVNDADKFFAKMAKALERSRASAVVFPLGVGGHVDHRTAMLAAVTAAGPVAFYEDQPYAAEPGAPIEEAVRAIEQKLGSPLEPDFAGEPTDVDAAVARRRRMALCFVSQLEDAQVAGVAGFCARYGGRERLWRSAGWRELFAKVDSSTS
jgi:LmbE family N-acetylglucosaminyl deacetylase